MFLPEPQPHHDRPQVSGPVLPHDAFRGRLGEAAGVSGPVPYDPVPETFATLLTLVSNTLSAEPPSNTDTATTAHGPAQTLDSLLAEVHACMPVDEVQPTSTPSASLMPMGPGIYIDLADAAPPLAATSVVLVFCIIGLVWLFKILHHQPCRHSQNFGPAAPEESVSSSRVSTGDPRTRADSTSGYSAVQMVTNTHMPQPMYVTLPNPPYITQELPVLTGLTHGHNSHYPTGRV